LSSPKCYIYYPQRNTSSVAQQLAMDAMDSFIPVVSDGVGCGIYTQGACFVSQLENHVRSSKYQDEGTAGGCLGQCVLGSETLSTKNNGEFPLWPGRGKIRLCMGMVH
jgi:hypothetical protein